ncbi:hypothetical protein LAZ67_3006289 [Cordylochernes scorpioides]|uniref:Retrovirus-related Pol polyprotein from transposon TNT 1-94 n=1 Tax=Cordylochernes scorpioides TaxID=51811 RepID=A0ABY6KB78_9ARAC|nr:hypothetical protein LAZ67_3006289 [Cordylochernes scorpioides]
MHPDHNTGQLRYLVRIDTPAKFIPRFLTNEQKLCRLATCEDMMEMTRTNPEWKDKIITGDETWVYGYDPETKPQSAEWRVKFVREVTPYMRKVGPLAEVGWDPPPGGFLMPRKPPARPDARTVPLQLCHVTRGSDGRTLELHSPDRRHTLVLRSSDSSAWFHAVHSAVSALATRAVAEAGPLLTDVLGGATLCHLGWLQEKARLVAKGYSQQYGIDYEETFAPVVRQSTIRMFLALAVEYNLILHQMDVQSAYLNGEIKEEIYMTQPENFVSRKYPEKVCRLKKAIYGLKQAGIVWHEKLDNELKNLGLKQLQSDNCVYIKHDEGILLVAIYVDDLIIAAEREDTLKSFKESMKRIFKIKDLGGINCCLGIRIQMKEDGSISIDQERYIEELLAKYRMKEAKPISTPMDSNSKLTKISSIEGENEPVKKVEYQSLIGSLIYLSVSTRPDIAYAVSALGQFSNDPRRQHWNAAKRVLRYLKGTSCLRITYRKSNEALHGYVDADWGGNLVDRKSHTGIVCFLARGPIAWESKKQQTVTLSSTESEYIALCEAGKEAVYLRALLDEMGFGELLNGPTVLKTDNQGAQQLARNPVYHARTKHIDIKWHYIRSICSDGLVEVVHTPTQENVADILTKGLPRFFRGMCVSQSPTGWRPVFLALTSQDLLSYDLVPWTREAWAVPASSCPLLQTRLVQCGRGTLEAATFTLRLGSSQGVDMRTLRTETHRDLALWARSLVQGAHDAAVAQPSTFSCLYQGQECQLSLNMEEGMVLRDSCSLATVWQFPFQRLRHSADDGTRIVWLDFGEDREKELDMLQNPKPFVFTLHSYLSAKVTRLGLMA